MVQDDWKILGRQSLGIDNPPPSMDGMISCQEQLVAEAFESRAG